MGSLPWMSMCINMQACPSTFCACDVTLPLFLPFLLLKLREACAVIAHISAVDVQGDYQPTRHEQEVSVSCSLSSAVMAGSAENAARAVNGYQRGDR